MARVDVLLDPIPCICHRNTARCKSLRSLAKAILNPADNRFEFVHRTGIAVSIIQSLGSLASFAGIRRPTGSPEGLKPYLDPATVDNGELRRARSRLINLFRNLELLAEKSDVSTRFKLDLPDARSANSLALDLTTTAAFLQSAEEINTAPMSFSPFGPEWRDGSTAAITIGGVYDGTHGSGELSFEVRRAGVRGVDDLRIRVEDPDGNRIRNVNVRASHSPDRQYDLRNGLYLTLGPGALVNRDFTVINVSDSVGAAVDPTLPLGGVRNLNPNLEFGGPTIVDGNFEINGETIAVATTDSINDVIARINASAASVSASFDSASETIQLLQDQTGATPSISFAADSSNFLAATKLATASVVPGIDPDTEKSLDDVTALASIEPARKLVNRQSIADEPAVDSLDDIIARINASPAGVVATFDTESRQVLIESADESAVLELDSNGTEIFSALEIPEGRLDPEAVGKGISRRRSYAIADATTAVFDDLNLLLGNTSGGASASVFGALRGPLESALRGAIGADAQASFGLRFASSTTGRRGPIVALDRNEFTSNLQRRGDQVQKLLAGQDGRDGLIVDLLQATDSALALVNRQLGLSGRFVDTFA